VIPLKGEVVRSVESAYNTASSLSHDRKLPEGMNFGLGIKLLEQHPEYTSLLNSLQF